MKQEVRVGHPPLSTLPKMEQTVIGTNEAQMDEIQIGVALPVS